MNEELKNQKFLCLEFVDADGNTSKDLSKYPADVNDVVAALRFLKDECAITISLLSPTLDDEGKIVSPFDY